MSNDTKILNCDRFLKIYATFLRSFFVECGFSNENAKSDCFEDPGVARRIKLNCSFKKYDRGVTHLAQDWGPVLDCCEHHNDLLGFIK